MTNWRLRIIFVFLIIMALFLVKTEYTDADIFAERNVANNRFSITTIDFTSRNTANNVAMSNFFRTTGFQPGGFDLAAIRIKKDGRSNFKYRLKTNIVNNDVLCQALRIQVLQKNFTSKYQGRLTDLAIGSEINNNTLEDWIFYISLDDNDASLRNRTCEFNFDIKTWVNDPNETGGIHAKRILSNIISSGNW